MCSEPTAMQSSSEGDLVITTKAGLSDNLRLCSRFNTTNAPKPTTDHCSACGFTDSVPICSGGRGEIALVSRVRAIIAVMSAARTNTFTTQYKVPALRVASENQLQTGVTETSTARLETNGCGSCGDSIPSIWPRFGSGM